MKNLRLESMVLRDAVTRMGEEINRLSAKVEEMEDDSYNGTVERDLQT